MNHMQGMFKIFNIINFFIFFRNINNNKEDDGRKTGELVIKPRPLTIKKQPSAEMPRLKNQPSLENIHEKRYIVK